MSRLLDIHKALQDSLVLPFEPWTPSTFEAFCAANPDVVCELDPGGNIIIISPTNTDAGGRNQEISGQLYVWSRNRSGYKLFDSSTGFLLPNGAVRSPDAAVVRQSDWDALAPEQQQSFAPLVPLFLVELRSSETDSLSELQAKMEEYLACGVALAWLVDPAESRLHIYHPDREPEILERPATSQDSPLLPGFILDFARIW